MSSLRRSTWAGTRSLSFNTWRFRRDKHRVRLAAAEHSTVLGLRTSWIQTSRTITYAGATTRWRVYLVSLKRYLEAGHGCPNPTTSISESTGAMQYVCLIYVPPDLQDMPERDSEVTAKFVAFTKDVIERGVRVASGRLADTSVATTVRLRGGQRLLSDGPFAEAKEVLADFISSTARISTRQWDYAPGFRVRHYGAVEVRPVCRTLRLPSTACFGKMLAGWSRPSRRLLVTFRLVRTLSKRPISAC